MSAFAALTANMMELGFWMNFAIKDFICNSISSGCSPTGTLVRPEKKIIIEKSFVSCLGDMTIRKFVVITNSRLIRKIHIKQV